MKRLQISNDIVKGVHRTCLCVRAKIDLCAIALAEVSNYQMPILKMEICTSEASSMIFSAFSPMLVRDLENEVVTLTMGFQGHNVISTPNDSLQSLLMLNSP